MMSDTSTWPTPTTGSRWPAVLWSTVRDRVHWSAPNLVMYRSLTGEAGAMQRGTTQQMGDDRWVGGAGLQHTRTRVRPSRGVVQPQETACGIQQRLKRETKEHNRNSEHLVRICKTSHPALSPPPPMRATPVPASPCHTGLKSPPMTGRVDAWDLGCPGGPTSTAVTKGFKPGVSRSTADRAVPRVTVTLRRPWWICEGGGWCG
jgi:hypothetical protein